MSDKKGNTSGNWLARLEALAADMVTIVREQATASAVGPIIQNPDLTRRNQQGKRPREYDGQSQGGFKRLNVWVEDGTSSGGSVLGEFSGGRTLHCQRCKRLHKGPCNRIRGLCDTCRQPGHVARNCSNNMRGKCYACGERGHVMKNCLSQQTGRYGSLIPGMTNLKLVSQVAETKGEQQERHVSALVPEEATSSDTVAGILLICVISIFVFINSGFTYSYMPSYLFRNLNGVPGPLGYKLMVHSGGFICS